MLVKEIQNETYRQKKAEKIFLVILIVIATFLLFTNIGNQYLWDDEAQTALLANSISTYSFPMGRDTVNTYSQENGAEYGLDLIYKWHPWLSFYVTALFFKVFGVNEFGARFGFALFGLLTVVLVYFLGRELSDRRVGMSASILLLFSIPFLLLAKQCRYYSLTMFFTILVIYEFVMILHDKRKNPVLIITALVLLFYSANINYGIIITAMGTFALFFRRDKLSTTIKLTFISMLFVLPWVYYVKDIKFTTIYVNMFSFENLINLLPMFAERTTDFFFYPLLLIIPGEYLIARFSRKEKVRINISDGVAFLLIFSAMFLLIISFAAPLLLFRYLGPLIPVACVLMALILESLFKIHLLVGVAVMTLIIVFKGCFHLYIYEITHDYDGPTEGIVKYLKANAAPRDIVAMSYGDIPVKFYTGLKCISAISGDDFALSKKAKWVIIRNGYASSRDFKIIKYMKTMLNWNNYERIVLYGYPDILWENREDLRMHYFKTEVNAPPVLIFRKKDGK